MARLTCEFVRPVPLAPLAVAVQVVRPGRRVTLLEATVSDPDGTVVTRARGRCSWPPRPRSAARDRPGPSLPRTGRTALRTTSTLPPAHRRCSPPMRWSCASWRGRSATLGPATAWFRLRGPVVDGAAGQRCRADRRRAADFGNGIATELSWR